MENQLSISVDITSIQNEDDRSKLKEVFQQYKTEINWNEIELDVSKLNGRLDSDILILFEDRKLLEMTNKVEYLPNILIVELPGTHSFFAEVGLNKLSSAVSSLLEGSYKIHNQLMFNLKVGNLQEIGLNDLYIASTISNTRIRYDMEVENQDVFDNPDSSNGILLSTPTGSTAMAMNLGGALIDRNAEVFQFQAIASRNFLVNQRIISSKSEIKIKILDANFPLLVQIDSRRYELAEKEFILSTSDHQLSMIALENESLSNIEQKLTQKLTLEDTADLTSSAKFILHVLRQEDQAMKINDIMGITHLTNQKTVRNSLKLLIEKGLVRKIENIEDMREHLYIFVDPLLSKFYS